MKKKILSLSICLILLASLAVPTLAGSYVAGMCNGNSTNASVNWSYSNASARTYCSDENAGLRIDSFVGELRREQGGTIKFGPYSKTGKDTITYTYTYPNVGYVSIRASHRVTSGSDVWNAGTNLP